MEFNFEPLRLLTLAVCLGAFAYFGGFSVPQSRDSSSGKVVAAWEKCVLMFVAGAVCVSIVDHRVGLMDPTSLRLVYIIAGFLLMAAAMLWLRALKDAVEHWTAMRVRECRSAVV